MVTQVNDFCPLNKSNFTGYQDSQYHFLKQKETFDLLENNLGVLSAIIIDESSDANSLKNVLSNELCFIQVNHICSSLFDLNRMINSQKYNPDVIFLDIKIANKDSVGLINMINSKCKIILMMTDEELVPFGNKSPLVNYILKPWNKDQIFTVLNQLVINEQSTDQNSSFKTKFLLNFGKKYEIVKTENIAFILVQNKIAYFHTFSGQRIPTNYVLNELEESLNPKTFFRANRQIIVNSGAIEKVCRHDASRVIISLKPNIKDSFVISSGKTKSFLEWLKI